MKAAPSDVAAPDRKEWISWLLLWVGVLSASSSAILIRYADGAEPLAISFWRSAAGSLALLPFAMRGLGRMRVEQFKLPVIAGVFLAIHFATWIASLEKTTIAESVLLVTTTPIFTALGARWLWNERLGRAGWTGIGFALVGTAVIASGGIGQGSSSLTGDALALSGGIAIAGYAMAGQISRRELGILQYAVVTYGAGALLLLVVCLIGGVPLLGYEAPTWWALAGIIIGPQLMGHTIINLVLRDLGATTVSVAVMAETIIAIILAWLIFHEAPTLLVYPGGLAILLGIYLTSGARRASVELPG
ncbi:MAG: hypothetical protein QOK47_495 [Actinomycetota bacterium]|nr:hypothetical protein [Actinomycetota bacterium]